MDIIDIMLARAMTPQGKTDTYVAKANAAAAKAEQAEQDAAAAVAIVTNAAADIQSAQDAATAMLSDAQTALETVNAAIAAIGESGSLDTAAVDAEVKKLILSTSNLVSNNSITKSLVTTYPDNTTRTISNVVKYYTGTGNNEDGTMTQKAITAALQAIPSGGGSTPSGGGTSISLDPNDAGQLIIVDENGSITASGIIADDIASFLIKNDLSFIEGTVGLKIDYANKTFVRTQDAIHYNQGTDFNQYNMYGGRIRCNVTDDGTIAAFYGDQNYTDDGSNGQVMVYQPKFYYSRITLDSEAAAVGEKIKKEVITLSPTYKPGFKLHPLFINEDGEALEYVLLPAYEGSGYDVSSSSYDLEDSSAIDYTTDKLSSIANAKPISGVNKTFNLEAAEQMAQNRGEGWHITTMAAESANQMLELVEFGTLNGQSAFESGITGISNISGMNCASNTGSTAALGNETGYASSTTNITNGTSNTYNNVGRRAISYRGMENPWGNMWRYVGDMKVIGSGNWQGGKVYININNDDIDLNAQLSSSSGYASYFEKVNTPYDWMFIPIEVDGNSALPIGDQVWTTDNLNGTNCIAIGGRYDSGDQAGPFAYMYDSAITFSSRSIGARLMFIPTKNNIYSANLSAWENYMDVSQL